MAFNNNINKNNYDDIQILYANISIKILLKLIIVRLRVEKFLSTSNYQ